MSYIGEDLLAYLKDIREHIDFVSRNAEIWDLEKASEPIKALFLPRTDPLPDEPSAALGRYIRASGLEDSMAAIVYPDRRGAGYGVARYNDHPRLDFTRVSDAADVHFAHNSGFLCKTSATAIPRLKAQILEAWE